MEGMPKTYVHWSERQDSQLIRVLLRHGRQWEMLQHTYFPEFNVKQMKNRFQYLARTALDQRTVERIRQDAGQGAAPVKEEVHEKQKAVQMEDVPNIKAGEPQNSLFEAFDSLW